MAATPEPIAIVGIGCRLAGSINDPAQFWTFLTEGRSDVREVPEERWEPYLRRDPRNAAVLKETTRWGTFLDDLAGFDAEFFGVSPREAELMDPQQRLALEVSWEALEHAGVPPRTLAGSDTAVLMGVNSDDYGKLIMEDLPGIEAWTGIGTSLCGIANRVSHLLDLRGSKRCAGRRMRRIAGRGASGMPDASCRRDIAGPGGWRQRADRPWADPGARRGRRHRAGRALQDVRREPPTATGAAKARPWSCSNAWPTRFATATGCSPSCVAARSRRTAARWASCRPTATPRPTCSRAHANRRVSPPASVDFVEAHGTGTPSGDPTEVRALASVYGADRPADAPCRIGSVKPNVGHLEGGAGVVGLIKAALALHHEAIPPTAGLKTLTPAVDWANSGLRVPTSVEPWARTDGAPRRAAVCSYGYGGTIAHILLEEAPATQAPPTDTANASPTVVPISARSSARLRTQARALADHLRAGDDGLDRVAATAWTRRSHESARAAVVAEDIDGVVAGLDALANDEADPLVVTGSALPAAADGAVWVFSGHGSHWAGMGQQLARTRARVRRGHRRDRSGVPRGAGILRPRGAERRRTRRHRPGAGLDICDAGGPRRRAARARSDARRGDRPFGRRGRRMRDGGRVRPDGGRRGGVLPGARIPVGDGQRRDGTGAAALRRSRTQAARAYRRGRGDQRLTRIDRGVRHRRRRRARSAKSGPTKA